MLEKEVEYRLCRWLLSNLVGDGLLTEAGWIPDSGRIGNVESDYRQKNAVKREIQGRCVTAKRLYRRLPPEEGKVLYAHHQKMNLAKMLVDDYRNGKNPFRS